MNSAICNLCDKCISSRTVNKLSCGLCGNMYHVQCTIISKKQFKIMDTCNKASWMCGSCVLLFPFNHIVDNNLFLKCTNIKDCKIYRPNYENLLFNPFDLLPMDDEGTSLPCDIYDPDIHYYNHPQNVLNLCGSKYYDIDEFNSTILNTQMTKPFSMFHCNVRIVPTKMPIVLVIT